MRQGYITAAVIMPKKPKLELKIRDVVQKKASLAKDTRVKRVQARVTKKGQQKIHS